MEDWQLGKNIVSSLEYALDNNHLSDVEFHFVEEDPVVSLMAHKLILSLRSPVFQAMFFGPVAGECGKIEIHDIESSAFAELLRYIYTDEVVLCQEDVLDVLSASHKYFITGLVQKCSKFLIRTISMTNVCELLEKATLFGVKDLQHHCLVFIDLHTKEVLKTDGFLSLSRSTVERILAANTLHADEFIIYQAIQAWVVAECNRHSLDCTVFENRRVLAEPLVNLIRFPLISPQKFSEEIVGSSLNLLTPQETINLFQIFTRKLSNPHDIFCQPRKEEMTLTISRFEEDGRCRFWCQGIEDKFQFTTNTELVLSESFQFLSHLGRITASI
ncbi:BTB/POZ domain-containing protein 3-like isoform X2 [Liolophura sinensis]|uniref:BTB/POZ domain-containing protein 3-like isoform X2 n=1 Tax=Liolophura sinensis TaxID=3198878 RepID=UPI00315956F2